MAGMHPFPIIQYFVVILAALAMEIFILGVMGLDGFFYLILLGLITIIILALIALAATFKTVIISEEGVTWEKGVFSRETTFVPYQEISDFKYSQPLLERAFGVGTLFINTAGSPSTEIVVRSLKKNDITLIMKEMKEKVKR